LPFAKILKDQTHAAYGLAGISFDHYEAYKDTPLPEFYGLTPRQAYIIHSEVYTKPQHGKDAFGRFWLEEAQKHPDVPYWLISDSGFAEEAVPVVEAHGRVFCLLFRLHREGCSFRSDSRSYISLPVGTLDIRNDETRDVLKTLLRESLAIHGWA